MMGRLISAVVVAALLGPWPGSAQEPAAAPALGVFRQQAGSIASDVLGAMGASVPVSVALAIEDAPLQTVVENALLAELSSRGVAVRTAGAFGDASNTLRVLVLEQRTVFDSLGLDEYRRTIRTALEARLEPGDDAPIRYLGAFERTHEDTVRSPEAVEWVQAAPGSDAEDSTFSRIVAPLVIIAGAALIVYLFFAVRSS